MRKIALVTAVDTTLKFLLINQIRGIRDAGYEVHGVCTEGFNFEMLGEEGVEMHAVKIKRSISPFSDLMALWKMYCLFRNQKFDVVHTHTPKCSLLGQLAAKLAGVPVIVNTVHGFYFHDNMKPLTRKFYVTMEWIAARCSSHILSQNPEDIDTAVEIGICKRDRVSLLGNGVNLELFDPERFDDDFKIQKRKEIGIPQDAVVVGIIGRLVREKGYIELFEAMQKIMEVNEKVWLMIIGHEEPEKVDRISGDTFKEYGIEGRTMWLGPREDIPDLLACCDIYTLPSWREGFPRSAIEAACMGLPIVATNIRGCRQVVDDGENGLLVPLKDVDQLESALAKLVDDPDLRFGMGQYGRQKALREFDENQVCRIVLKTYDDLIKTDE